MEQTFGFLDCITEQGIEKIIEGKPIEKPEELTSSIKNVLSPIYKNLGLQIPFDFVCFPKEFLSLKMTPADFLKEQEGKVSPQDFMKIVLLGTGREFAFKDRVFYREDDSVFVGCFELEQVREEVIKILESLNDYLSEIWSVRCSVSTFNSHHNTRCRQIEKTPAEALSKEEKEYLKERRGIEIVYDKLPDTAIPFDSLMLYSEFKSKLDDQNFKKISNKFKVYEKKYNTICKYMDEEKAYEKKNGFTRLSDEEIKNTEKEFDEVCPIVVEAKKNLDETEKFISENVLSPKGYFDFLKKSLTKKEYAFFLKQLLARVPASEFKKHSYIVAKTGSGKTELIKSLIFNEIYNSRNETKSIILIDPHGDCAEEIARFKEFAPDSGGVINERLVYVDPTLKDGFSPSINPFELKIINDKTVSIMTQELKRIFNTILAGSGTTMQMDAILAPCISTLLRRKGSCFKDLQRFMDDKRNDDLIELGQNNSNPEHANFFKHKFRDEAYKTTKNGVYTRIQILLNDPIFQNLISNKTTLDLEKLTNEKKIILFKLPLGEVGSESVEAFGRFIVGIMRVIALKRSEIPKEQRIPIHLYIDEFQNFVSDDLEKALTQLRKYGLHLTLANQFAGQVETQLQKALFSSGVIIAGQNERKTLKSVEQEIEVNFDELKKLKVGEFFIKFGTHQSLKIKVPSLLLENSNSMSSEDWKQTQTFNLQRYYRRITNETESEELRSQIMETDAINAGNTDNNFKPKYDI